MKVYVFMGKGGVGKSTIAVEAANILSKRGKTVCLGVDQQHNHRDIIEAEGYNVDYLLATTMVDEYIEFCLENLGFADYKNAGSIVANDFIAIMHVSEMFERIGQKYEYVCVDMPPNHSGLGMCKIPDMIDTLTFKALTIRQRANDLVQKMKGKRDPVLEKIDHLRNNNVYLLNQLAEAKFFTIGIPTYLGIQETEKAINFLVDHNYKPYKIIMNMFHEAPKESCYQCRLQYMHDVGWKHQFEFLSEQMELPLVVIPYKHKRISMKKILEKEL